MFRSVVMDEPVGYVLARDSRSGQTGAGTAQYALRIAAELDEPGKIWYVILDSGKKLFFDEFQPLNAAEQDVQTLL